MKTTKPGNKTPILVLAAILALITAPSIAHPETCALLVGTSRYPEGRSLDYAAENVENMQEALVRIHGIPRDNVSLHVDEIQTSEEFATALGQLLSRCNADMFIIYLTGHGGQIKGHSFYEMNNDLFFDYELKDLLADTAVQSVVIVDAPNAGGFAVNCAGPNTVVMTASSVNDTYWGGRDAEDGSTFTNALCDAFAWERGRYGLWDSYFIDWQNLGITLPESPDANLDGTISLDEAFEYAKQAVESVFNNMRDYDRHPQIDGEDSQITLAQQGQFVEVIDNTESGSTITKLFRGLAGYASDSETSTDDQGTSTPGVTGILQARVDYPSATGIYLRREHSYAIKWSGFPGSHVKIKLYKGGRGSSSFHSTIATSAYNDGSYTWNVPSDHDTGDDFQVKITSLSDLSHYDYSNNDFTITLARPKVKYPSDADIVWKRETTYTIRWAGYTGSHVKIELYKGSTLNRTITAAASNDGTYSWYVPEENSTGHDFRIRITSLSDPSQSDYSNNYFTIEPYNHIVLVDGPRDGAMIWEPTGSTWDVEWFKFEVLSEGGYIIETQESTLSDTYMYLFAPGGWTEVLERDDNDGVGNLARIDRWLSPGTYYVKVRADLITQSGYFYLHVSRVTPQVTEPSIPGDVWLVSETHDITWTGFTGSRVKIELYHAKQYAYTIDSSTANDGTYSWTIASDTPTTSYVVKITSVSNPKEYDHHDTVLWVDPW